MKRIFTLLLLLLFFLNGNSQLKFDSIYRVINTKKTTTEKLDTFYFAFHRKKLSSKETASLKEELRKIAERGRDKKGMAMLYYRYAWIEYYQSKYNSSIAEFFKCLKIAEEISDSSLIANTNTEIADAYIRIRNMEYAKRHLYMAFKFLNAERKEDMKVLDLCYQSLCTIYRESGQLDSSLLYANKKLEFALKRKNKSQIANSYNSLALTYREMKDYDKAIMYLEMGLEMKREIKDQSGIATTMINVSNLYRLKGNTKKAIELALQGLTIAYENNLSNQFKNALNSLADDYMEMKEYKSAAYYYNRYNDVRDSLYTYEMNKQLNELTAVYETEKKDAELTIKEEQLKTSTAENSKQRVMIIASGIALILACIAIFFIYRSFQQNKRNAKVLAEKNHLIEEKQKEILSSIRYAKRIQMAHLPSEKMVENSLKKINKK